MRISDWSSDVCSSDLHVAVEGGETVLPRLVRGAAARAGFTPGGQDIVRHDEGRIRPAELLAGRGDFFLAQWRAVRRGRALQLRRAIADHRAAGNQRRAVRFARWGD